MDGRILVCPRPSVAADLYNRLLAFWEQDGSRGDPPPLPLLLGGWIYSSDKDKLARWQLIKAWAETRGAARLLANLDDGDFYFVSELSTSYPEQHYRPDRYKVRDRPPADAVERALNLLTVHWESIAGSELSKCCSPIAVTGKKARRLLVQVFDHGTPPWGGWTWLSAGPERRLFTEFRHRINELISPVQVDHVDFDCRETGAPGTT